MKEAIGGFVLGAVVGAFAWCRLFSYGISEGINRGPVIYEDENTTVKQYKSSKGELSNIAWVFNKEKESEQ